MDVQLQSSPISAWLDACKAGKGNLAGLALEGFDPNALRGLFDSTNIGTGFNWSRFNNKQMDALLETGATTPDPVKRAKAYSDIQRLAMDQVIFAPIYVIASLTAMHSYVHDYQLDVTREFHQFYDVYLTK